MQGMHKFDVYVSIILWSWYLMTSCLYSSRHGPCIDGHVTDNQGNHNELLDNLFPTAPQPQLEYPEITAADHSAFLKSDDAKTKQGSGERGVGYSAEVEAGINRKFNAGTMGWMEAGVQLAPSAANNFQTLHSRQASMRCSARCSARYHIRHQHQPSCQQHRPPHE